MDYPKYLDHKNNRVIFVHDGLGGDEYGTFYTNNGAGYHRVKSNSMPMVESKAQAQKNLDSYAAKNGFREHKEDLPKTTGKVFFTKCCKKFRKNTTASTTGYEYDVTNSICMSCPFAETIYRYKNGVDTPVHECRAGEKYCNENDYWTTNITDKTTLYIRSLNWNWIEDVKNTVVKIEGVIGASYNQDLPDCRKNLSIAFSPNKKGLAAKKKIVDMYFNNGGVDLMPKDGISSIKKGILAGLEEMEDINSNIKKDYTTTCNGCQHLTDKDGECYCLDLNRSLKTNKIEMTKACANFIPDVAENMDTLYVEKLPEPIIHTNIETFDYSIIDEETAGFLQDKANRITEIRIKSVMAIGKEFKEAQERLASHDKTKGTFQAWVKSLGFDPKTAYNYINGFMYVMENFHNIEDAEKIQPSLLFAISKPSAHPELQEQVISGDITTHKQYKELEEKLKAAEKEAETKQQLYETISKSYDRLEKKSTEHYEKAKSLEEELQAAKKQLLEAQSSGDSEEAERLKQLLRDTESKLQDSKQEIEELEQQLNDSTEIATAVVEVEKVPDEVLEELEALRNSTFSTEISIEVKTMLKILNSNILSLGRLISTAKKNTHITTECKYYIEQIRDNMSLLKKISLENLNKDLFDFIKD